MQLTRDATFDDATDPALSPDGAWLAFRGTPAGSSLPQLYVARVLRDANGNPTGLGVPVRITPAGSRNASPAFSPDGRGLVFASSADASVDPRTLSDARPPFAVRYDALAEIFRADAWQRSVAAGDPRLGVDLARHPITDNRGFDGEPGWSPDGRFLAFASDRAAPAEALATKPLVDLWICRADGTLATRLTTEHGFDGRPAWSPDGGSIAFESERRGPGRFDIWVQPLDQAGEDVPVAAGPARRLTDRPDARDPAWHPSGEWLLYSAADPRPQGGRELRRIDADGSHDRVVDAVPEGAEAPTLDRSGDLAAFAARTRDGSTRQIYAGRISD